MKKYRANTEKQGVIVLGGHVQGYGIVRVYGENGIPCVVMDETKYNIARHSKYCSEFYEIDYEVLIEVLLELGRKGVYKKWLLFPTNDYYVRLLSQNRGVLNQYFVVTVDDWGIIQLFFNKKKSYPLVESLGVPCPKTFYPDSIDDVKKISYRLTFPCIIKPAIVLDFYKHFKKKVFVCNDLNELIKNYCKATTVIDPKELLIQEIIPGSSEHQYAVGIFFDRSQSYNYLAAKRKRQHPVDFGNATTYAETIFNPVLIEYAHTILSKTGYFGICEVEFKFDERDGRYKFLEVNPRTWKWHLISMSAGIPFLMSFYQYVTEGEITHKKDFKKAGWRDFVTDVPIMLTMIKKGLFIKDKSKVNVVSAVANANDLKPFIFQMLYLPYLFLTR